jgi:hypothetical protein
MYGLLQQSRFIITLQPQQGVSAFPPEISVAWLETEHSHFKAPAGGERFGGVKVVSNPKAAPHRS